MPATTRSQNRLKSTSNTTTTTESTTTTTTTPRTTNMQTAARTFMSSPLIAVAGASSNPQKFGHKIFAWYLSQNYTPIPINPASPSIKVQQKTFDTLPSPSSLREPGKTSLSIITPPEITKQILKEARDAGVKAVWLQPGSFGADELAYAEREFPGAAVGGFGDGTVGGEGWCVLVDGERALREAKKKREGEEKL
jgi:predicted CoA-binding protein